METEEAYDDAGRRRSKVGDVCVEVQSVRVLAAV